MTQLHAVDQLAIDEKIVEDSELEAALEAREEARDIAGEARATLKERQEAVDVGIEKLELPDDVVVRVGRFRISRQHVAARHVEFDTDPTTRIAIRAIKEDE